MYISIKGQIRGQTKKGRVKIVQGTGDICGIPGFSYSGSATGVEQEENRAYIWGATLFSQIKIICEISGQHGCRCFEELV